MDLSQKAVLHVNKGMLTSMKLRATFAEEYCDEKGWNVVSLSLEQVLTIRAQEGWKKINQGDA